MDQHFFRSFKWHLLDFANTSKNAFNLFLGFTKNVSSFPCGPCVALGPPTFFPSTKKVPVQNKQAFSETCFFLFISFLKSLENMWPKNKTQERYVSKHRRIITTSWWTTSEFLFTPGRRFPLFGTGDNFCHVSHDKKTSYFPIYRLHLYVYMGVSKNSGTPKWMVIMEIPIKMDDLGVPLFLETPINIRIYIYTHYPADRNPLSHPCCEQKTHSEVKQSPNSNEVWGWPNLHVARIA